MNFPDFLDQCDPDVRQAAETLHEILQMDQGDERVRAYQLWWLNGEPVPDEVVPEGAICDLLCDDEEDQ